MTEQIVDFKNLTVFDNFESGPVCVWVDADGVICQEQIDESEVEQVDHVIWCVWGHLPEQGVEWLCDCPTKAVMLTVYSGIVREWINQGGFLPLQGESFEGALQGGLK